MPAPPVPADVRVRPSRVQNIDTDRLRRRLEFLRGPGGAALARACDGHSGSGKGGLADLAREIITIELTLLQRAAETARKEAIMNDLESFGIHGIWDVGGSLRDEILGVPSHDRDLAVECDSFDGMVAWLEATGSKILHPTPKFLTVKAKVPKGHLLWSENSSVIDLVGCRGDSDESDGRRPDHVVPASIHTDLDRRDFTVNAMARNVVTGEFLDPHDGRRDLSTLTLRFVGDPATRITEDGLRVVRAFRFIVTKGFSFADDDVAWAVLLSPFASKMMAGQSRDTMREELGKMFKHDTLVTLALLRGLPEWTVEAMFGDDIWLQATQAER